MAHNPRFATAPAAPEDMGSMAPRALSKQEFGKRLYKLMLAKNWNQSDLARAAGLGRDAISTYIRGRSFPEPVSAKKLADALGIPTDELYPNSVEAAMDAEIPAIELKQSSSDPTKAWLRVNRMVSISTAAKIIDLLKDEQ